MRTRVLEIDGLQVVARVHGSGERSFVLVHGLGMSSYYFRPLAERLARYGTAVSLNLPGFGPTRDPDRRLRIAQFARVALRATERLGIGPAVWVGHSMGTQIVTDVARQDPSAVERLVLLAPVINEEESGLGRMVLRFTQAALHETPPSVFASARAFLRAGPRYVAEMVPALLNYPLSARLAEVTRPVTLVVGELDALTPPAWVERLLAANPGATSHTIFGASHQMMHTHADETTAVIAGEATPAWRPRWRGVVSELAHGLRPGHRVRAGSGTGRVVLLLPGMLERSGYLWRLANHLSARGHRVLTVPDLGWNLRSLERAADAAFRALGDERDAVIVAHSKGGLIGKRMLIDEPGRLAGMVAIATPFNGSDLAAGFARSPLLRRTPLALFDPAGAKLKALTAATAVDHRIVSLVPTRDPIIPNGSRLDGATNVDLPQVGHFSPVNDPAVWDLVTHHIDLMPQARGLDE